jgi:uncharacterized protein
MSNAESLYRLQMLDNDLDAAQKRLVEIDTQLKGTPALAHARSELTKAEQAQRAAQAELKSLEFDAQTLDEKISGEEQRLYAGQVRAPKEMVDIQHELEGLKKRRASMDDDLLAAMERAEQTRADELACRQSLTHAERNFADDNTHLKRERETTIRAAQGQIEQRKALAGSLPKEAIALYTNVRAKKPNRIAVALIKAGACGQCGQLASSQSAQQARTGQTLAICSNCGRILYA